MTKTKTDVTLTATNTSLSDLLDSLKGIKDPVDQIVGVFMTDEVFQSLWRDSSVKFNLLPKDDGEVGFAKHFRGCDVYEMPEEEVFLGNRDWFFVTQKEYDEYIAKIEELRRDFIKQF